MFACRTCALRNFLLGHDTRDASKPSKVKGWSGKGCCDSLFSSAHCILFTAHYKSAHFLVWVCIHARLLTDCSKKMERSVRIDRFQPTVFDSRNAIGSVRWLLFYVVSPAYRSSNFVADSARYTCVLLQNKTKYLRHLRMCFVCSAWTFCLEAPAMPWKM
jgi:hypothetical protein